MFFKPKPDILFLAVDNQDLLLVRDILVNHRKTMDRVKAYEHAVENNYLEIAYIIRKSYTYD